MSERESGAHNQEKSTAQSLLEMEDNLVNRYTPISVFNIDEARNDAQVYAALQFAHYTDQIRVACEEGDLDYIQMQRAQFDIWFYAIYGINSDDWTDVRYAIESTAKSYIDASLKEATSESALAKIKRADALKKLAQNIG